MVTNIFYVLAVWVRTLACSMLCLRICSSQIKCYKSLIRIRTLEYFRILHAYKDCMHVMYKLEWSPLNFDNKRTGFTKGGLHLLFFIDAPFFGMWRASVY